MAFVNQFSFLLLAGITLLLVGWLILRSRHATARWAALAALATGLVLSYWIFNPGPGDSQDLSGFRPGSPHPTAVLLEFESPYCLGCMAAQSTLDRVRRTYAGDLQVVQVNVLDPGARPLLSAYGFRYTPTFIYIDPSGEERWRSVGTLDPAQVAQTQERAR